VLLPSGRASEAPTLVKSLSTIPILASFSMGYAFLMSIPELYPRLPLKK